MSRDAARLLDKSECLMVVLAAPLSRTTSNSRLEILKRPAWDTDKPVEKDGNMYAHRWRP